MQLFKTIAMLFLASLIIGNLNAQSPDLINYQAVAYNSSGNAVANTAISIRVTILQGSTSGPISYQETHNPGTDANGAFDLQIGGGAVVSGTFAGISWGSFSHYLRVEMDVAGGTSYIIMGTSQMVSVPYAKYAETAGSVGGGVAAEMNAKYYHVTSSTVAPGTCSAYSQFDCVPYVAENMNKIIVTFLGGTGSFDFIYNPSTLAVTSGDFGGSPITGGSISSDFTTFTLIWTSAGCTYTLVFTRQ